MMTSEWLKMILYLEKNTKNNTLEKLDEEEAKKLYQQLQDKKRTYQTI